MHGNGLHLPRPIWNKTLTPIARTQSTIRNAKISGIELIYKLKNQLYQPCPSPMSGSDETQESHSRQRGDRYLHIDRLEMLIDDRQVLCHQRLEDPLI